MKEKKSKVCVCFCATIGALLGVVFFIATLYWLIVVGVFKPTCPKVNGRICNGYGICSGGYCRCDPRFSGKSCAESLIPKYNAFTGQQCSGHGFGWPFSNFTSFCRQTVIGGVLVGPGWYGAECRAHVETTLQSLQQVGNNRFDPRVAENVSTIPWCQCEPPWTGVFCDVKGCPSDENALICGGNGNSSVGILTNQTTNKEKSNGCQCSTQVHMNIPPLLGLFTAAQQEQIQTTYYSIFSKTYCAETGIFIPPLQLNALLNPENKTVITNDGIYKCYCQYGWGGVTCTDNRCPHSLQSGKICSGAGNPLYGQGLITNTTKQFSKGLPCLVNCVEGTSLCNKQSCITDQSPDTPLFSQSRICAYGSQCTLETPLRCYDGSCVPIPQNQRQCPLNYETGSVDPLFMNSLLKPCVITGDLTLRSCFRNNEISALAYEKNAFLWNASFPIRFNTTSPLIYFQIAAVTSESTIVSALWSQQTVIFSNFTTFISGSFRYNNTGEWILDQGSQVRVTQTALGYTLCNISTYNFTGDVVVPLNYSQVKITDAVANLVYIFTIEGSSLALVPLQNHTTYVLIATTTSFENAQQWFFAQTGRVVQREFCLANPSACSFIIWNNQARNLQSTIFLCISSGIPIMQSEECSTPWSTLKVLFSGYITTWETCITGTSLFNTPPILGDREFELERNYTQRSIFENEIRFLPEEEIVRVSFPAFLTVADITFPCACPPIQQIGNRSTFNQQWWNEVDLRPVEDLVLGEWVLTSTVVAGAQEFLRSKILAFSPLNQSFTVWNPQLDITYDSFYSNSRSISLDEVLKGSDDGDMIIRPFRCPDGQKSAAESITMSIPANCNCTLQIPLVECACDDRMNANWTCACLVEGEERYCQCTAPALPEFELKLLEQLTALAGTSCQCIIYDPQPGENTNSSVTTIGEPVVFNITLSQIPEFLIVKTSGVDCNNSIINVTGLNSQLFSNRSIDILAAPTSPIVNSCEHWFLLGWPNERAISTVWVQSSDTIVWATLQFSIHGFSLITLPKIPGTVTASSEEEFSPVVVLGRNSSFWVSNQTTSPVFIELDAGVPVFLNYISVVFYESGVKFGNKEIPWRIYFQGWLSPSSGWKTIASFGVYVERGGWAERSLAFDTSQHFSKFRLITEFGNFGVRQWSLYTNQACLCADGSLLTLQLTSTQGLPTIQSILNDIAAYDQNLLGAGCVCENQCLIQIASNSTQNFSNNGVCEDAIFWANTLNYTIFPELLSTTFVSDELLFKLFTPEVFPGISSIQFANDSLLFLSLAAQQNFFTGEQQNNFPNFPPETSTPNDTTLKPNQTIYYVNSTTLVLIPFQIPRGDLYTVQTYVSGTFFIQIQNFSVNYGGVVENNLACCAGCDCNDCGSSIRQKTIQKGVRCQYTPEQNALITLMGLGDTLVNQTYFVKNLSSLTTSWTALYQDIKTTRAQAITILSNCPGQVCPLPNHYRCLNGKCVQFASECEVRFNCPGNGCVQQTDAASIGNVAYRCACQLGYGGNACQFENSRAATPNLFPGQLGYVPGGLATHCGGIPPLRLLPPILNQKRLMTPEEIVQENFRTTANSPKKTNQQINYLRVMPSNGWGAVITFIWQIKQTPYDVLSQDAQDYQTDCAPARRGPHGQALLLTDDLAGEDPITFAPIWKVYQENISGVLTNVTYKWDGVFPITADGERYHDFPYRCPNGQCVQTPSHCAQSVALFPTCNGNGVCRADGYCECSPGKKTGTVNARLTELVKYPFPLNNGIPDPTIWEINFNWRNFGLLQCLERDCEEQFCGIPTGCFPGTVERSFVDRWHFCIDEQSKNFGKCAPPGTACDVATNLQLPLVCSGNGIPKIKDFTGEVYCYCGSPISSTANINEITQITDLKSNGWGGVDCTSYFAPPATLVWSPWDNQRDQPHFSIIGRALPGVWLKGVAPQGPLPEQRVLWENCCDVERLEECPNVICDDAGTLKCIPAGDCIFPKIPQIFDCNGHGVARADGTCLCDSSQAEGRGFTNDFTQFSINGCYREFQCPISGRNNAPCYFLEACSLPGEFRYPAPQDQYLAQQTYMCGPQEGLIQNSTIINQISTSADIFLDRLIQALTQIAIEVGNAIAALSGCICVYPTDTQFQKTGMLPGGNFTYLQSYHAPALLYGAFVGYPLLTDLSLETYGNESYVFPAGKIIEFNLANPRQTMISAIRVYADQVANDSKINILDSSLTAVCDQAVAKAQSSTLQWLYSTKNPGVAAFYCGPLYECASFEDEPGFTENCGASSLIQACEEWKTNQCLADPGTYIYWPLGSPAVYEGCERGANGCTCCQKQIQSQFPPILDGKIKLQFVQGMRVGQIEIYGVTDQALPYPPGLVTLLQNTLPDAIDAASCQDYQFLSGTLGAPESYFIPREAVTPPVNQLPRGFNAAFAICNNTGSYLAVPQSSGEAAALVGTSNALMRQCNLLQGVDKKECWVGARDTRYNELYTDRGQMFLSECTTCYEPSFCALGTCPLSFSTYPNGPFVGTSGANYRAPAFSPSQVSSLDAMLTLFPSLNFLPRVIFLPKTVYTQLCPVFPCSDPPTGCSFFQSFQLDLNEKILLDQNRRFLYVTFKFNFVGTSTTPHKVASIQAWKSATLPLIQTPGQDIGCVPPCFQVDPNPNRQLPSIQYGQMMVLSYALCDYFQFQLTEGGNALFCNGLTKNPTLIALQLSPPNCGIFNIYPKSICTNLKLNANKPTYLTPSYSFSGAECMYLYGMAWAMPKFSQNYRTFWGNNCGDLAIYDLLGRSDGYGCIAMFNADAYFELRVTGDTTRLDTQGNFGDDFLPGLRAFPYLPVFIKAVITDSFIFDQPYFWGVGVEIQSPKTPVYFIQIPTGAQRFQATYRVAPIPICSQCQRTLEGNFEWQDFIFRQTFVWNIGVQSQTVQLPPVKIWVQKQTNPKGTLTILQPPPTTQNEGYLPISVFVHLTTYIESRNRTANSTRVDRYQWYLSTCLGVSANSYILRVCQEELQYICQFDYMKYAVVTGYMCPACGDNTRVGATPRAGATCYDSNPLANATANPVQHLIYDNYLRRTLYYYATTITSPASLSLPEGNVVWGIPECWEHWANGQGTRGPQQGGTLPRGQLPNQNWYDMCLSCNWGVDCQKEGYSIIDPATNEEKRTCATAASFCDLSVPVTGNSPLQAGYYPPIFTAVNPQVASIDKTCGDAVLLSSFSVMDKYGVPQSDILVNFTLLESTSQWVQLQVASLPAIWYNSGKTNLPMNKFSWNVTSTIYGQYQLVSCPGGCSGVEMRVIIYPLSIEYAFPTRVLSQVVPLQVGTSSYSVKFSPTSQDTGVFTINEEVFPLFPFQGVGFNISAPPGTVLYLYNPVIIDNQTISQCTTRKLPNLVEPLTSIVSTVPFNKCIFNEEIQLLFPGQDIGTCGCAWALAGERCDCIAVTTKYTQRVCGGFGSEGTLALAYDGQFYSTGQGENSGCFLMANGKTDCFTKDVGTCTFALLVDGAVWNFPSVYVDTPPANGQSLFVTLEEEEEELTWEESIDACRANGNQLAYWFTADELTQFVKTAPIPSFIAANFTPTNLNQWPWANDIADSYFVNGFPPATIFSSVVGGYNCLVKVSECAAMNFNNIAYNASSCLTDGNSVNLCPTGGTIFYEGPLNVYVVVFSPTPASVTVSCVQGGACSSGTLYTQTAQFRCRCPFGAVLVSQAQEVQIFTTLLRTTFYIYN